MAGAFSKHRFQIYNQNQHPYKHSLAEFAYTSNGLPGVTNVEEAVDWLIATIYPLTQSAVNLKTDLPLAGVVTFSGSGVVQSAPAAFSVDDLVFLTTTGTLPPSYSPNVVYKILSKTGAGIVLGQQNGTPITFVPGGSGVHTINSIANAFRVVFDDGDGKAAAYRWEKREGDVSPTWYKIYDMDWSQDAILAQFQNVTQDLYAYKKGKNDTDSSGTPLAGLLSGQHIYGGASSGTNLTLHANAGDLPGVHSGEILLDDSAAPTVTNLFDIGTLARRFKNLYLSLRAQVSTLNIASGLITDSTGLISFDNENLVTTGNISATNVTAAGTVSVAGDITINSGLITSASGLISFADENLLTIGFIQGNIFNLPLGSSLTENVGGDLLVASSSGTTNFSGDDLTNIGVLTAAALAANSAAIGNLTLSANEILSTGRIRLLPNVSDKFVEVVGGFTATENSTFSANLSVGGDLTVTANQTVGGTFGVAGITTLAALFVNGDISTAGTFLNFLKYIVAPRLDAAIINATTVNATSFKGTNLIDPSSNSVLISNIAKFPFTASTQDFVPHWDTATTRYIAKAITYPAHGALAGLTADDHTQYALLAGRAGGQTLAGAAAAAAGNLRLIGQAGAAGANKIISDDKFVPGTNANFTSSWQGYDLGSSTENWRHLYSKGEHFGLRFENVSGLPAANAANIGRIVYNTVDQKAYIDLGGTWQVVGSGSGSGGVTNLVTNGSADDAQTSIFTPYADTGTRPVDGAGGSPTVTTSLSSTAPLTGTKSFILSKTAANSQGQGWAATFSVDPSYRAKSLKISVDYIVSSGTFVAGDNSTPSDGDVIWYLYDVTNSQLIEPSNIKMFSSSTTISDSFQATFQTSVTGTSYRLIAHVASTSALAFDLKVDNVTVSPQVYVYGTPVTDFLSYTPTFAGVGTPTGVNTKYRRVGDSIQIYGSIITGTVSGANATISLPAGLTIDTSKVGSTLLIFGDFTRQIATASTRKRGKLIAFNGDTSNIYFTNDDYTAGQNPNTGIPGNGLFSTGETINFQILNLPVLGWSSSVQMSDSADTRVTDFSGIGTGSTQSLTALVTNIAFTTVKDSHGAWTGSTYVVKSAGDYFVSCCVYSTAATLASSVYVNGVKNGYLAFNAGANQPIGGSKIVMDLKVNDVISFRAETTLTMAADTAQSVSIAKIQGPQAIAATEKILAKYTSTAGQSIAFNTGVQLLHANKAKDSHGAYNTSTGIFTCPAAGDYRVAGCMVFASLTGTIGEVVSLNAFRNGSQISEFGRTISGTVASAQGASGSVVVVNCVQGDQLSMKGFQAVAAAGSALTTSAAHNYVSFERIG